ncbi:hypothetical protein OE88DRAFT_744610 [Heliocybe sulcata]|uniref:Uncharacterized protein n=1 Tax=Heliocybe sulcata TaxID=5364 RepID=A0A5C3MSD7_9AGAM|nr:hypothetical protein OE88DRAFT_744610 [Heliocybe sulcata]
MTPSTSASPSSLTPMFSSPPRSGSAIPLFRQPSSGNGSTPVIGFRLKLFLGDNPRNSNHFRETEIIEGWDDEMILRHLGLTYDEMRGKWRRRLSIKRLCEVSLVKHAPGYWCDKSSYHPEQPGPYNIPAYMAAPALAQGKHALKGYLSEISEASEAQLGITRKGKYELGLRFVEGWQAAPILVVGCLVVLASTVVFAICYWRNHGDLSTSFTIAAFIAGLCATLLAVVQIVISIRS